MKESKQTKYILMQNLPLGIHVRMCADVDEVAETVKEMEARIFIIPDNCKLDWEDENAILNYVRTKRSISVDELIAARTNTH